MAQGDGASATVERFSQGLIMDVMDYFWLYARSGMAVAFAVYLTGWQAGQIMHWLRDMFNQS